MGKKEEAEQVLRKVFSASKRILGPQHPSTVTISGHLARVLDCQGKHAEAFMVSLVWRRWRVGEVTFEDVAADNLADEQLPTEDLAADNLATGV